AKTWRFEIRKGVEFHNGKTLEPADVVASINYHRGADTKSAAKFLLKEVSDVKTDGQSVIITLEAANADFAFILADYHLGICPSRDGVIDWASGVGTGPYKFEAYEPGVRAIGSRNEKYFKADAAYADSIELLTIQNPTVRASALMTNSIDVMDRCDPKIVAVLRKRPGIVVTEVAGNLHYTMPMDVTVAPFDNLDVRLALKYAIDREAILKSILRGHGVLGNDHPIGRGNRYLNTSLPQRHYDPDKARFHLKKAGAEGLTVSLSAADAAFAGAVDAAVLVAEQAKQVGITINVIREPNDGYWSNVWMKKPWCMAYWSGRATEDLMFSYGYSKNSASNDTHWSNERFETLLVAARAELDDAKRRAMYWEMQKIVSDDGGAIIPVFASYVGAHSGKVGHPDVIASNLDMDGGKVTERWWIDS
ncbi:ABC transporter substrate-binding protein, partial [Mesorhizobium australicum]|uniref:ABC transporter substrate-binding protein n=1 Tax=Mesorhizobium australicum TaxID=536018 RepID=UPI00333B1E59